MHVGTVRTLARQRSRVDSNGASDTVLNEYINQAIRQFAHDVGGLPTAANLTIVERFNTETNFAIRVTITGGTNALTATDVAITSTQRTRASGTTVASDLQTAIRAAGPTTLTVTWTDYYFTIDTIDGTAITIGSPSSNQYVDATTMLFGGSLSETESAASVDGGFPAGCTKEVDLPSYAHTVQRVEWDGREVKRAEASLFDSPESNAENVSYYEVLGERLRLHPSPNTQKHFRIWYRETPAEIVTFTVTDIAGTTTNGSKTISSVSAADIARIEVGEPITGTGVGTGAIIDSIGTDSFTVTVNSTATGAQTDLTLTNGVKIPDFPEGYHDAIVYWVAFCLTEDIWEEQANRMLNLYNKKVAEFNVRDGNKNVKPGGYRSYPKEPHKYDPVLYT